VDGGPSVVAGVRDRARDVYDQGSGSAGLAASCGQGAVRGLGAALPSSG